MIYQVVNNDIIFKTPMLRSELRDYSHAYTIVKATTDLGVAGNNDMTEKGVEFKNNVWFSSSISKNQQHIQRQCRRSGYYHTNV